ncbi:MAG: beta-lactamase family protein [Xanthomonadales bacterium]|nr:beta-lactamase family protein [Xanthomonadales bacterium]
MHARTRTRGGLIALALALAGSLANATGAPGADAAEGGNPDAVLAQASVFWQTVAADAPARPALLERHFSAGIRARNGDDKLLETFAMLAESLAPELATLPPPERAGEDQALAGELHYTLASGRRVALTLALTDTDPPQIERFSLRPLPPKVEAVGPSELPGVIDARLTAEAAAGRFSGAVLVARGEEVIFERAVGLADRATGRANTLDTPINLGSINKMFTGIAIAQLQESGKLDWQDTVGRHLPDFPNATVRDTVTLHQLLTHTSGVGSYWNEAHDARLPALDSQQAFLDTFIDQPLLFEPGQGLEYSNGGPVVLGLVIEALSGSDYYQYIREHIYTPAGMKHADHYRRDDADASFAVGYARAEDGSWRDHRDGLSLRGSAAGGGYASARDLHGFSKALADGRLLPREKLETLWQPHVQTGPMGYGYLFSVGGRPGRRFIGHNGGASGISAAFMHYPDDGLAIVVLANQDQGAEAISEWLQAQVEAALFGPDNP